MKTIYSIHSGSKGNRFDPVIVVFDNEIKARLFIGEKIEYCLTRGFTVKVEKNSFYVVHNGVKRYYSIHSYSLF